MAKSTSANANGSGPSVTSTDLMRMEYTDSEGIRRRVLAPAGISDLSEGIPVSVPVDQLYEHMPLDFRRRLMEELWARGLVEPSDFLRANAFEMVRAAWLSVARRDALDILNLAKGINHD